MESWFRLTRSVENGEIVVSGPGASFCSIRSITTRYIYRQLSRLDLLEHRCVAKFRTWGLTVEWRTVWLNLHLWNFIRPVRDTNWLIAHAVLPTADRLIRFGMRVDPLCHCGQSESLVHLFVECQLAKRLFAWYQSWVHRAQPSLTRPTPCQLLVGYHRSVRIPPVFPCLLGTIRHQIWVARNGFRFDERSVIYGDVLNRVKSSLRFNLRIQLRHCPRDRFSELWLAGDVLGHVSEEDIIVFSEALW